MLPYTVKYTETESDIQHIYLFCNIHNKKPKYVRIKQFFEMFPNIENSKIENMEIGNLKNWKFGNGKFES